MAKEHRNKTHSHLLGIVSQLNNFHTILPKSSPHTIHGVYDQESTSCLPKGITNNMIFLFEMCHTFDRTTKGRTWLASQCHADYTQLIWSSSIKIYVIDSQKLNYVKNKAIAFGRKSHLLVSNMLFPTQMQLDLF